MFCLYWDAKTKKVHALNGSGRSPKHTTLEQIRSELELAPGQKGNMPLLSALAVTVPGAAAGWCDVVERFGSGKLTMEQILTPAIELGEKGFPVSQLSAALVLTPPFLQNRANDCDSGKQATSSSEMLPQTFEKCFGGILEPRTSCEHHELAKSCKTLHWQRPSEHWLPKARRDSTLVA